MKITIGFDDYPDFTEGLKCANAQYEITRIGGGGNTITYLVDCEDAEAICLLRLKYERGGE
jgi:hypothetical protein